MNTALEYNTRVVQEGGRRCKKSTLNDLVHLAPLRIPLMNPPIVYGKLKSENAQDYAQKNQRNCTFMNSAFLDEFCVLCPLSTRSSSP
jgi:hypothetical protein